MAAELPQLHVVAMGMLALLEYEDKFVLTTIKRAHAGIVLHPDAEVFDFVVHFLARVQEFPDVTPVHADEVNRPVATGADQSLAHCTEKIGELSLVHFAASHREI